LRPLGGVRLLKCQITILLFGTSHVEYLCSDNVVCRWLAQLGVRQCTSFSTLQASKAFRECTGIFLWPSCRPWF